MMKECDEIEKTQSLFTLWVQHHPLSLLLLPALTHSLRTELVLVLADMASGTHGDSIVVAHQMVQLVSPQPPLKPDVARAQLKRMVEQQSVHRVSAHKWRSQKTEQG